MALWTPFVVSRKQKAESRKQKSKKQNVGVEGWGVYGVRFFAISDHLLWNFFLDQIVFLQKGGHTKSALAES